MPRSAIAAGRVDLVLSPERIAVEVARIARHSLQRFMALTLLAAVAELPAEHDWTRLFRQLRTTWGVNFTDSKRNELDALFQDILICLTGFYREAEILAALPKKAILTARARIYGEKELRSLSLRRLRNFLASVDVAYQYTSAVSALCLFARDDVTKDQSLSRQDLISCCDALIYFEPVLKKRVLTLFRYALTDLAFLLWGKSESLGVFSDLFTPLDHKNKFFIRDLTAIAPLVTFWATYEELAPRVKPQRQAPLSPDLEKEADRLIWDRCNHAGLVVNNDLQILHFRGDTSRYLKPVPGKASFHLFKMIRGELDMELRAAVQRARRCRTVIRRDGIRLGRGGQVHEVSFDVTPLPPSEVHRQCFLILFEDSGPRAAARSLTDLGRRVRKGKRDQQSLRLQDELAGTRDQLHGVIREQESIGEELRRANEEVLSSMEELRSANEELEAAKEELQSSNEELVTLNEQLQNRNAELARLSDDLSNVISGADVAIVILDGERRIRRFTPTAQRLLGMLPGDVGRPIGDLRIRVNVPDLDQLISSVVSNGDKMGREVQGDDGRWYSLRIRPFRTAEQNIEGVLMALFDIHEQKQNQESLQREQALVSAILDSASDLLVMVVDREGRIVQFNRVCQQLSGYSLEEVRGRKPWEFMVPPDEVPRLVETFEKVLRGAPSQTETHWLAKDGRHLVIGWSNTGVAVDGSVESVIASGMDKTESSENRKRAVESEATVRALLEMAQPIIAVNQQGRILVANAASEKMFGYSHDEIIGQEIVMLLPERLRQRHSAHVAKWFSQPISRRMGVGLDLAGLRKDGTELPVEVSLSYHETVDGIAAVAFISDVTEKKKNEQALLDYQSQLQKLTANLMSVQEAGSKELARELHDDFSQQLAALAMEVSTLQASGEVAVPLTERLSELGEKIGHLANEMHQTSRQLHPTILNELGLEAALREECGRFSAQCKIPIQFICEELPASTPEDVSLCLYRIAQETLRNIRKHAGATEGRVRLFGGEGGVSLLVEDTGDGFDIAEARKSGGLGLISMEERVRLVNGKFKILSQTGVGTTVGVFVPLNEKLS
jgi:PAS domain S-box-containing protein